MSKSSLIGAFKQACPAPLFRALQRYANRANIKAYKKYGRAGIDLHKIVFLSPTHSTVSGNFEFILKGLEGLSFKTVVMLEEDHAHMDVVMREVATAGIIFADDFVRYMYSLPLSAQQKFVQVWHSTGAFKRMGFSRMGREGSTRPGSLTHRNYTDVIVSSEGVVDNFAEAFGIERARVHPYGVPRTDIFFDEAYKSATRARLRAKYALSDDEKLVLFAPTYRGNDVNSAYYPSEFIDIDALSLALGPSYVLGLKLHPFIKEKLLHSETSGARTIELGAEREINDLLLASDILISDYSSVIFEYALLEKPVVFYAPDIDDYVGKRDFFYDYDQYLYGPLAKNQEELVSAIKKSGDIPSQDLDPFKEKFLSACDGHSTERCIEKVVKTT